MGGNSRNKAERLNKCQSGDRADSDAGNIDDDPSGDAGPTCDDHGDDGEYPEWNFAFHYYFAAALQEHQPA